RFDGVSGVRIIIVDEDERQQRLRIQRKRKQRWDVRQAGRTNLDGACDEQPRVWRFVGRLIQLECECVDQHFDVNRNATKVARQCLFGWKLSDSLQLGQVVIDDLNGNRNPRIRVSKIDIHSL